ncbi:MAG: putative toxin-antitoxin system toxin component, PIN family [Paludibacteraceae bacterium]|nr:putative toxin-antitoxin system toxin component, PIN family [Paludibacteraceae bacterium]
MKRIYYAVFDTNVLVSALLTKRVDSPTVQLLDYVFDGQIILLYNEAIIREYEEVLHRGHFAFPDERVRDLIDLVKTGLHLDPTDSGENFIDEDDKVFYEVALTKDDGYVVTGNTKHFPKSPIVVTPAEMVAIIQTN